MELMIINFLLLEWRYFFLYQAFYMGIMKLTLGQDGGVSLEKTCSATMVYSRHLFSDLLCDKDTSELESNYCIRF